MIKPKQNTAKISLIIHLNNGEIKDAIIEYPLNTSHNARYLKKGDIKKLIKELGDTKTVGNVNNIQSIISDLFYLHRNDDKGSDKRPVFKVYYTKGDIKIIHK